MKKLEFAFLQVVFFTVYLIKRRLAQICLFSLVCGLALSTSDGSGGAAGKYCRAELSVFYHGMQSLGDVWGRSACEFEHDPLAPGTVADMRAALADTINALGVFPAGCIPFDVARIRSLSDRLPSLTRVQLEQEVRVNIILELQRALARAHFTCDHGVNPSALFVAGVHLGAAQAFASCYLCHAPIRPAVQTVMHNHLTTAHDNLAPYAACIPTFDFSQFGKVPLGSPIPGEPHTHIIGIESQLLWSIALSPCCCTCSATEKGGGSIPTPTPTPRTTPTPRQPSGPGRLQLVEVKQDPPCKTWGNITSCNPNGGNVVWYNTNYQWNSPPQQVGPEGFTITLNISQNRPPNDRVSTGINMSGGGFELNPPNASIPIGAPNQPMSGSLTVTVKPPRNPSGDYYLKIGVFWGPGWTYHYRVAK